MGRAEDQNLAARWRRWTLVSGGGKSTDDEADGVSCASLLGVVVEERGIDGLCCGGEVNALVLLARQVRRKRCSFIVLFIAVSLSLFVLLSSQLASLERPTFHRL